MMKWLPQLNVLLAAFFQSLLKHLNPNKGLLENGAAETLAFHIRTASDFSAWTEPSRDEGKFTLILRYEDHQQYARLTYIRDRIAELARMLNITFNEETDIRIVGPDIFDLETRSDRFI